MKNVLWTILVIGMLTACAAPIGDTGATGPQGPQGPAAPVTPETTVQQLVDSENAYRETLGQTELSSGMACSVQAISSGGFLSTSSPNYVAATCTANPLSAACGIVLTGTSFAFLGVNGFNQPNSNSGPNNIIDPQIQSLFTSNNYRISCSGQLVVTEDGYHGFSVASDDGAILTVDGAQVTNNDGNHGITTAVGTKNLRTGVHTLSVLYAQSGAGQFALVIKMDGAALPAANLYH